MNENEIRDVLGEGIGAEPPIAGGPAAVFAGARARVVRTRAVTGALSVVAVLGVAAGAVALGGGSGGAAKGNHAVSPGAAGTTPSAKPSKAQPATSTPTTSANHGAYDKRGTANPAPVPGPGRVLMDGRSAGEIVRSLMPAGLVTANLAGQDSDNPAQLGVRVAMSMSLDDGSGRLTTVGGDLNENQRFQFADTNCATEEAFDSNVDDCRSFPQSDGSVILTYLRSDATANPSGPTKGSLSNVAVRAFPDGTAVELAASNYFAPPSGSQASSSPIDPTRQEPLLTQDQLKAVLMDGRWGLTVSAEFAQQARRDLVPYIDGTQKN